jgi:predicted N-acetyltransferase YhbS
LPHGSWLGRKQSLANELDDPGNRGSDHDAILRLVKEAFREPGRDGQSEVEIVQETWTLAANLLGFELVATDDQLVVGHILGARADLGGQVVVGIAPLGG